MSGAVLDVPAYVACIAAAIAQSIARGEHGFQVAAYLGNDLIVDACAGEVDRGDGARLDGTTLFPIFSVTKAITITAIHLQAERGLLDVDLPIARYWPEFGVRDKHRMTIRDVLSFPFVKPRITTQNQRPPR